ncbi:MAG: hypothetical protein CMN30_27225 [Sandaracinus sp.]|nr:hypothetical protein [Sandaracinus sp.]
MIFAVAMLPGIVASRTWLSVAGLRPESFKEYRLGSIFVWSAASGLAALLNAARLTGALDASLAGDLRWSDAAILTAHLFVGPWLTALGLGVLARRAVWAQGVLQFLGVIRPGSRTPWDELFGDTQSMQVTFSWEGRTFYGYFSKADTEGTQLYVEDVCFEADGEWWPVPEMTGALILDGGDHVFWLHEPLASQLDFEAPPTGSKEAESDPNAPAPGQSHDHPQESSSSDHPSTLPETTAEHSGVPDSERVTTEGDPHPAPSDEPDMENHAGQPPIEAEVVRTGTAEEDKAGND